MEDGMIPFYENSRDDIRVFHTKNILFPAHLHNSIEFIYVEKGSMCISVNQEILTIRQGDFVVIFPNAIHSYQESAKGGCLLIIAICGQKMTGDYRNKILRYFPVNPVIPCHLLHPNVVYALKELVAEPLSEDTSGIGKAFIQLILSRIFPLLTLKENSPADIHDITYQVIDYISAHYQEPLTLASLSKVLCVSKYHLSRIFSNKLHLRFNDYLNSFRLDYAASMLQTSNQSITSIALESGFESSRTFNRVFKAAYGISPREYRTKIVTQSLIS